MNNAPLNQHHEPEWLAPDSLVPWERNARTHSRKQVRQIANSILEFGFVNPVLIDANNRIIAGHGRVAAALSLNMSTVPTLKIEHLTEAQLQAYVIADNRLAELAGWDMEILAGEFHALVEIDFDVELTGFDIGEIDMTLSAEGEESDDELDHVPDPPDQQTTVTRLGDVWMLGDHALICGDALESEVYTSLMGLEHAQMVFTDPPYNVPINGHVSGKGAVTHREFAMASGEMSPDEFKTFLGTAMANMITVSAEGAVHMVCMDWRHVEDLLGTGGELYDALLNLVVWRKTNAGMGSLYRSQHELIAVFRTAGAMHRNNVLLGKYGRHRSNIWTYAGANTFRKGRMADLNDHPTVKPVKLVADAILDVTARGGIVLDPFAGSGTILLAAERTGRVARAIELDPGYCDVAVRRWQAMTVGKAVLKETNETFAQAQQRRASLMKKLA